MTVSFVTEQKRAADVIAETDVVVYTIERGKFLNFIVGTEFEKTLHRLAKIRNSETWNLLSNSPSFQLLTSSQKTWLESIFISDERNEPGELLREGDEIEFVYIIRDGEVTVSRAGKKITSLKRGAFVGEMHRMHRGEASPYTFMHSDPVSLFAMKREDILQFVDRNPGLLMKLVYDF